MKQRVYLVLASITFFFPHYAQKNVEYTIQSNFNVPPSNFTQYVYGRFYLIKRLEETMHLFEQVNKYIEKNHQNLLKKEYIYTINSPIQFSHPRIKNIIEQINKTNSFEPLFKVWDTFILYQEIQDEAFTQELIQIIYWFTQNLINGKEEHNQIKIINFSSKIINEDILNTIDNNIYYFTHYVLNKKNKLPLPKIKPKLTTTYSPFIHVDDISQRFYHLQRLEHTFKFVTQLASLAIDISNIYCSTPQYTKLDTIYFYHPKIRLCIKHIKKLKNGTHFLLLHQDIKRYKYISDQLFAREYFLLTLTLYTHIIQKEKKSSSHLFKTEQIPDFNEASLEQILDAIEIIAEKLPPLLEKFEFNSDMPWKKWLKKYWWVPATIVIAVSIRVYTNIARKR